MKLCECGCQKNLVNEKNRFLKGHNNRGKKEIYIARDKRFFELHGVSNPSQLKETIDKIKNTNLLRFGIECSALDPDVIEKKKQTMLRKYGVDHYSKTSLYKDQIKNTCSVRYGKTNVFKLDGIKQKSKDTNLKKYGFENAFQSKDIQDKSKVTCITKYGVDNYSKTFKFRLEARNRLIQRIERNHGKINPRIGNNEKIFFDELQKHSIYPIILNQYLIGYYPDGRIEELKLIIEFDEPEHFQRKWYLKRDKQKDIDFSFIGYRIFRVKESDWLINSKIEIERFKNITEDVVCL